MSSIPSGQYWSLQHIRHIVGPTGSSYFPYRTPHLTRRAKRVRVNSALTISSLLLHLIKAYLPLSTPQSDNIENMVEQSWKLVCSLLIGPL